MTSALTVQEAIDEIGYGPFQRRLLGVYPTVVRGSGFGAASAMSRVRGAVAPLIGGALLATSLALPLAVYAAGFAVAAAAVWFLGVETRDRPLPDVLSGVTDAR